MPRVNQNKTSAVSSKRFGKTLKEIAGIVSYTFRNSCQKDVPATLDTIKSFGITNVEFSNLFGKTYQLWVEFIKGFG